MLVPLLYEFTNQNPYASPLTAAVGFMTHVRERYADEKKAETRAGFMSPGRAEYPAARINFQIVIL
jgi:hypothetical protein